MRFFTRMLALVGSILLLAGCSITGNVTGASSGDETEGQAPSPSASPTPTPSAPTTAPAVVLTPKPTAQVVTGESGTVPWQGPAVLTANHGRIVSATVVEKGNAEHTVSGHLVGHGSKWKSKGRLYPSTT